MPAASVSYSDIAESKSRGQGYYEQRLQAGSGQVSSGSGSQYGGIARANLRPAGARFKRK